MRRAILAAILVAATVAPAQTPQDRGRVLRAALQASERAMDKRINEMYGVDDPFAQQGMPRGMYLESYGAVFTVEVNLLQVAGLSPFRQTVMKEEVARIHRRKTERLPQFRENMRSILIDTAASLDPVPANEQVVLGVTLFYMHFEDTRGLPSQIVMSATRKTLQDLKLGRGTPGASIQVREY